MGAEFAKGRKRLFVRIARLMNYVCILIMVANAVYKILSLFGLTESISGSIFLAIYLIGSSLLLFKAELRDAILLQYFEFLRGRAGKGVFYILIGVLTFDDRDKFDMATGITMVLVGLFNLIVSFMRDDILQKI